MSQQRNEILCYLWYIKLYRKKYRVFFIAIFGNNLFWHEWKSSNGAVKDQAHMKDLAGDVCINTEQHNIQRYIPDLKCHRFAK